MICEIYRLKYDNLTYLMEALNADCVSQDIWLSFILIFGLTKRYFVSIINCIQLCKDID